MWHGSRHNAFSHSLLLFSLSSIMSLDSSLCMKWRFLLVSVRCGNETSYGISRNRSNVDVSFAYECFTSEWSVVGEKPLSLTRVRNTRICRMLVSGDFYKRHRMNYYARGIEAVCTRKKLFKTSEPKLFSAIMLSCLNTHKNFPISLSSLILPP